MAAPMQVSTGLLGCWACRQAALAAAGEGAHFFSLTSLPPSSLSLSLSLSLSSLGPADVMQDRTGRSKGWGIVKFVTTENADAAIAAMNMSEVDGRQMEVRYDRGITVIKPAAAAAAGGEAEY